MSSANPFPNLPAKAAIVWSCLCGFTILHAEDLGHPTLEEFKEEIQRADAVVQGRVIDTVEEVKSHGKTALKMLKVHIDKVHKGVMPDSEIVVGNLILEGFDCERIPGDNVVLLLKRLTPPSTDPKPYGMKCYYATDFLYRAKQRLIESPTGMGADLTAYRGVDDFVQLIDATIAENRGTRIKSRRRTKDYALGKVLFDDSFDDNSMSGWTLLKGETTTGQCYLAEGSTWTNARFGSTGTGRLERTRTGHLVGERDTATFDIGVYKGWLRLRSCYSGYNTTTVAGNPHWSDYQIDADIKHLFHDRLEKPDIIQHCCGAFGILGRVSAPNLPGTKGEHREIGIEFGSWYNIAALGTVGQTIQIRLKASDVNCGGWYDTAQKRATKFLDYQTYEVSPGKQFHVTAKFMGRRVEGWIDGKKCVDGLIPESNWGQFQQGRIALWACENFVEFDNVKVTELVQGRADR